MKLLEHNGLVVTLTALAKVELEIHSVSTVRVEREQKREKEREYKLYYTSQIRVQDYTAQVRASRKF